jgi:glycosyltransferase involved in cell wall biosynthesis
MGRLGIPFVLGPVGGGERTPPRLRGLFSRKERVLERVRDLANRVMLHDPLVADTYRRANTILAKTPDTLALVPGAARCRARCFLEVGLPATAIARKPQAWTGGTFRLIYVGRFITLKGVALGIRALARLREDGRAVTLSMVGGGPRLQEWQDMARSLNVDDRLNWLGWKPLHELPEIYRAHDALLFPSLHDSSGNAVLEGMAQGLPVVCLDVGGPSAVAGADAAMIIPTSGRSVDEVVAGLAVAVSNLMTTPQLHAAKAAAALERARSMTWRNVVGRLWRPGVGSDGSYENV